MLRTNRKWGYEGTTKNGISMHKFQEWKGNRMESYWRNIYQQEPLCWQWLYYWELWYEQMETEKKDGATLIVFPDDVYPTVFHNCPPYLSQKKPTKRPPVASSTRWEVMTVKNKKEELERGSVDKHNVEFPQIRQITKYTTANVSLQNCTIENPFLLIR